MDSDTDKRHYIQDVVAKCNFGLSPVCESWVTLGGATHTHNCFCVTIPAYPHPLLRKPPCSDHSLESWLLCPAVPEKWEKGGGGEKNSHK